MDYTTNQTEKQDKSLVRMNAEMDAHLAFMAFIEDQAVEGILVTKDESRRLNKLEAKVALLTRREKRKDEEIACLKKLVRDLVQGGQ